MKRCTSLIISSLIVGSSLNALDLKQFVPEEYQKFVPDMTADGEDAEEKGAVYGPVNLENQSLDTLTAHGPANLKKVTIRGKLDVNGPASIRKSTLESGSIKGPADFDKATVMGDLTVYGPLKAEKSQFGDIKAYTTEMHLKTSQAKSVTIIGNNKDSSIKIGKNITLNLGDDTGNKRPTLYLEKSSISGNVTFEGTPGLIVLNHGAVVKGKVINGETQKHK